MKEDAMRKKSERKFKRVNLKLDESVHHILYIYCISKKITVQNFVESIVNEKVKGLELEKREMAICKDCKVVYDELALSTVFREKFQCFDCYQKEVY